MTIQINSLQALERLIGGDSKLEIDIRNSVVQNFSKKHLKDIANTYTKEGIPKNIKDYLDEMYLKKSWGSYKLSKNFKKLIDEDFQSKVNNYIKNYLKDNKDKINEYIDLHLSVGISMHVQKVTKDIIQEEAKKLLIKKLN